MLFRQTLLAIIAIPSVQAQIPAHCARTYTVVPGDTCDGISAKESVSSFQLANVNKGIDAACYNLEIGEVLCLGVIGQDCQVVHVVESADTCVTIAHAAGTTLDILFANNPNVNRDCTNIAPGEVLCTADDVIVGSPPVVTSISTITVTPPVSTLPGSTTTLPGSTTTLPGSTTTLPGSTTTTTISVTVTVPHG
ncbi:hypothetical protein C8Q74DRAFT_1365094 [Fomes fomentarius]|nr:hypothetical protein C8Q74DRAFT_1365094 [Fomes fomentarius]